MTIDERISSELRRHAPEVDEQAAWERLQSAAPVRHRVWARRLVPITVAGLGVLVLGLTLLLNFSWDPAPIAALQSPFRGIWFSTDDDGSAVTMTVDVSSDGVFEITALDDRASVCSGAPSTMTGTGRLEGETQLVIPAPVLTCDDGTEPQALDGGSLEDILRDLTFTHVSENATLTDSLGSRWTREAAEEPDPDPTPPEGMWPQSSLEEVEQAQELADSGDPDYTWQVAPEIADGNNPNDWEIVTRFITEVLGWEHFLFNPHIGWDEASANLHYMRCATGETNPIYPDDEYAGRCAPTIDERQYETVIVDLAQPVRSDPTGLWVVSGWTMGAPFSQMVPPTDEAHALVEDFLQARIEGEGAEKYFVPGEEVRETSALLYETSAGVPYDRFEFEQVGDPQWPFGSMEFKARLFAGDTVVEQIFSTPYDGRLGLEYHSLGDVAPTTENGQPLAVPYDFFDGEMTMLAPHPWRIPWMNYWGLMVDQGVTHDRIQLLTNPVPVGTGCEVGAAAADAETLAGIIRADPDLETTEPVAVSLGEADGISMDVVAASGASVCDYWPAPLLLSSTTEQLPASMELPPGTWVRLYLLDLPEGLSARILAIAVLAPETRFESVMEAAAPILDSLEFHTG
jgi:hypothetical protein